MIATIEKLRTYVHPGQVIKDIGKHDLAGAHVLFINMPLRESALPNCAPNGVSLLAARLLKYEVVVTILDLNAYRFKTANGDMRCLTENETESLILKHLMKHGDQDVVALSGMITTLAWQEKIAKIIRRWQPDTFLVSGNGLATEFREGLFNWIPELNAVAHSEGDCSIVKIVYDAMQIKRYGSVKRALLSGHLEPYYIGFDEKTHRFAYDGGRPDDLDEVPFPAYDLLKEDVNGFPVLETYLQNEIWGIKANNSSATPFMMKRSINTISSRGCPHACSFCFRGATGERNYGVRSAENILKEMRRYHEKYNISFVGFLDDNFMVNRNRITEMVPLFQQYTEETGVKWGTHGRLDEAADLRPDRQGEHCFNSPKRVDQMAKAGCVYIGFGAESAHPETLKNMNKGGFILSNGMVNINGWEFPRTMVEGIRNTRHAGIFANCTWITGYPGETLAQLKTSVAFIKWQEEFYRQFGDGPDSVNRSMFVATAYPGTALFKHPRVRGLLSQNFGIKFDESLNPICDEALRDYVLELDDAVKVMHDPQGRPLNFSEMTEDEFLTAKFHVEHNQIEKILEMR